MHPYSTAYEIEEMFASRDAPDVFHTYLVDRVDVTVVAQDSNIGGIDKSMQTFYGSIYSRISQALKAETIAVEVVRVVGGGMSAWAAVESVCTATSKYETPYQLEVLDLVRFNSEGKITEVKEYGGHIQKHLSHHEGQKV